MFKAPKRPLWNLSSFDFQIISRLPERETSGGMGPWACGAKTIKCLIDASSCRSDSLSHIRFQIFNNHDKLDSAGQNVARKSSTLSRAAS